MPISARQLADGNADLLDGLDSASTNTASTVVVRDGSGNFSAGTITAAVSGNATTASTLQTARNINGTSFNGGADITIAAPTFSGALSGYSTTTAETAALGGFTVRYLSAGAAQKPTGTDHSLITAAYSSSWATQIAGDWRTNRHYVRAKNNGTWSDWAEVVTSTNIEEYAPQGYARSFLLMGA